MLLGGVTHAWQDMFYNTPMQTQFLSSILMKTLCFSFNGSQKGLTQHLHQLVFSY